MLDKNGNKIGSHNENILITNKAIIFHVDFEYILGKEPSHVLTNNPIKLTDDINEPNEAVFHCL